MPNIGPMELIIVLVIALVVLGPKRLPAAGRSLGQGMREFKIGGGEGRIGRRPHGIDRGGHRVGPALRGRQ